MILKSMTGELTMTPGKGAGSLRARGVSSVTYRLSSSELVGDAALPFLPLELPA
jgi:hypothetical protein